MGWVFVYYVVRSGETLALVICGNTLIARSQLCDRAHLRCDNNNNNNNNNKETDRTLAFKCSSSFDLRVEWEACLHHMGAFSVGFGSIP